MVALASMSLLLLPVICKSFGHVALVSFVGEPLQLRFLHVVISAQIHFFVICRQAEK